MSERITSRKNPLVAHLRRLTSERAYRREQGVFFCEGGKMLEEALRWDWIPDVVVHTEECPLPRLPEATRLVEVPEELLQYVAATEAPQKLVFTCAMRSLTPPERPEQGVYLVLDGLQDPGNVGTIWRSADAFDAKGIFLLNGCADVYSPKVVRATMGAVFRLPVWETSLQALCGRLAAVGIPLYATALRDDTVDVRQLTGNAMAVVIGSEGRGVSEQALLFSEKTIKIPMSARCESLNAAVAASLVLWELYR
ncbi:MAG: rRNA methyltransferase [Oscillospiraceae bacterium]|nr:rRNA methyltransferase [Oscillospiraceae bacterium]